MKIQTINHSFFVIKKTLGLVKNVKRCMLRPANFSFLFQTGPGLYLIDCKEEIN